MKMNNSPTTPLNGTNFDRKKLENHPINQNIYGNVAKADCDIQTDKKQGLCAITIVIVFIFATFLVYVNTRRKRREQNRQIFKENKLVLHPKPQTRPPRTVAGKMKGIGIN